MRYLIFYLVCTLLHCTPYLICRLLGSRKEMFTRILRPSCLPMTTKCDSNLTSYSAVSPPRPAISSFLEINQLPSSATGPGITNTGSYV
jgi:hypothetical protein